MARASALTAVSPSAKGETKEESMCELDRGAWFARTAFVVLRLCGTFH